MCSATADEVHCERVPVTVGPDQLEAGGFGKAAYSSPRLIMRIWKNLGYGNQRARLQRLADLAQCRRLVHVLAEDPEEKDPIERLVGDVTLTGPTNHTANVCEALCGLALLELADHRRLQIERDHSTHPADSLSGRQSQAAGAAAHVKDLHTGLYPRSIEKDGTPGDSLHVGILKNHEPGKLPSAA